VTAGSSVVLLDPPESGEYRPHLDGLRAVAVYLVVFFHAGSDWLSSGYIGVDVFFVLSGFLVTRLLLRDLGQGGAIRFGRFYSRRFRRLLPAAFVTLIVTAFVYTAIASPAQVANADGGFRASFLYSANWYFIHQARDYFATNLGSGPVLHFWSLAVEEQFYLLWPLALGGLFALTRRLDHATKVRVVRTVVVVGAVASMVWALSLRSTDPNRAYYGTDARAYELLAGALLALTPSLIELARRRRRTMRVVTVASTAALLLLASSWFDLEAIERDVAVTLTTCVLLLAIESADGGFVRRALSLHPVVYLGKISYGTYLWHWLVILVATSAFHLSSIATIAIACLVATAIASLSFEILEQPVRTWKPLDGYSRVVVVTGLALSVASALVLVPRIVNPQHATAPVLRSAAIARLTPRPRDLDLATARKFPFVKPCITNVRDCSGVKGGRPRFLVLGDSQAEMLSPLFKAVARREGASVSISASNGCPWPRDLYTGFRRQECELVKESWPRLIAQLNPDIIVIAGFDYGSLRTEPLRRANGEHATFQDVVRATKSSLARLRSSGRSVVIVEPLPTPVDSDRNFEPLGCLEKATVLEACRYRAVTRSSPLENLYRALARSDAKVHSLNLDRKVCPLLPTCDPVVNGKVVNFDLKHLAAGFSRSLAPDVDQYLKSVGLVAP
jgi:peptidoglycan/LPS O-acetylase OafA/YrhL